MEMFTEAEMEARQLDSMRLAAVAGLLPGQEVIFEQGGPGIEYRPSSDSEEGFCVALGWATFTCHGSARWQAAVAEARRRRAAGLMA